MRLTGVNRNTATLFVHELREVIFERLAAQTPEIFSGEIEVDESYARLPGTSIGSRRKGKRGCGAAGKVATFALRGASGAGARRDHPKCLYPHTYSRYQADGLT